MKTFIVICAALTTLAAGGALAQDAKAMKPSKKSTTPITREQREKMATMHEKMAACLRSEKPMSECQTQMRKSCQEMMGSSSGCPMMSETDGMMRHGGMTTEDSRNK